MESVSLLALLAVALVLSSAWVGTSDTSRGQLAAAIFVFLCFPTFLFLAWLYLVLRGRYENKFESSTFVVVLRLAGVTRLFLLVLLFVFLTLSGF